MNGTPGSTSYPVYEGVSETPLLADPGMSLRDYFAGKALIGLLVDSGNITIPDGKSIFQFAAKCSYKYADAMLEAREVQNDH